VLKKEGVRGHGRIGMESMYAMGPKTSPYTIGRASKNRFFFTPLKNAQKILHVKPQPGLDGGYPKSPPS
jgi:hypothetical protein